MPAAGSEVGVEVGVGVGEDGRDVAVGAVWPPVLQPVNKHSIKPARTNKLNKLTCAMFPFHSNEDLPGMSEVVNILRNEPDGSTDTNLLFVNDGHSW